jgi:hypothetical protein
MLPNPFRLRLCETQAPWHQRVMTGPSSFVLSLLMISSAILAIGGIRMFTVHKERGKGVLMLLAAATALGNALIWTL